MSTKSLLIRNAIVALLKATPVAGVAATAVYTDWSFAIKPIDMPAISVDLGNESAPQRMLIGALDRVLQVKLSVITAGDDATTAADPVIAEAHRRLVADLSLGGLAMDVKQDAISRQRDVLEKPVLITELNYLVEYRTTMTSMEA
jgi:hypothetical protein